MITRCSGRRRANVNGLKSPNPFRYAIETLGNELAVPVRRLGRRMSSYSAMMTPHLARGGKTTIKITLIHNPSAGDDSQPSGERIVEMIESAGHKVKYQSSKEKDWKKALKKRCDIIR